jgi:sarcosine oxidase delta subunit
MSLRDLYRKEDRFAKVDDIICPFCEKKHDIEVFNYGQMKSGPNSDTTEVWIDCDGCKKKFLCTLDNYNQNYGYTTTPINCKDLTISHKYKFVESFSSTREDKKTYNVYSCSKCWDRKLKETIDGKELTESFIQKRYQDSRPENQPALFGKKGEIHQNDDSLNIRCDNAEGNREVYLGVCEELKNLGYKVGKDKDLEKRYSSLNYTHCHGTWKGLELKATYYPAGLEIKFFQNIYQGERAKGQGEYEYNKVKLMPYLMKKRLELSKNKIINFLENHSQYNIKKEVIPELDWHQRPNLRYLSKEESISLIQQHQKVPQYDYNRKDGNGALLSNEDFRYAYISGLLTRGKVYYDLNSTWILVSNSNYHRMQSLELFTYTGKEPIKSNRKLDKSLQILNKLLAEEITKQNFEKCIIFRDLIKKKSLLK